MTSPLDASAETIFLPKEQPLRDEHLHDRMKHVGKEYAGPDLLAQTR